MYCLLPPGICFSFARSCRGAPASPDASCRRGTYFFTYGLPAASSRFLAIVRKRPLASVRCSVPPGASAIRASPMALGCCVGCATKKESEEVAGNAIPRSRLSSERKIAHSRAGSLCPKSKPQRDKRRPARSQRRQDQAQRRLQPFAGGGSGLTAARTINRTAILHSGRTPGAVATFGA